MLGRRPVVLMGYLSLVATICWVPVASIVAGAFLWGTHPVAGGVCLASGLTMELVNAWARRTGWRVLKLEDPWWFLRPVAGLVWMAIGISSWRRVTTTRRWTWRGRALLKGDAAAASPTAAATVTAVPERKLSS